MWSCSELFARDLKATVEKKPKAIRQTKKFGREHILNLITPPIPCSWWVPCLSLCCLELPVPEQHTGFPWLHAEQ